MTQLHNITPLEALHLQALLPALDAIIERRAKSIIQAKHQGKETAIQEKDLNTLYQIKLAAESLMEAYNAIIQQLQEAYSNEASRANQEIQMLTDCYRTAANGEAILLNLFMQKLEQ
jgi:hypothetical protein